MKITFEISDETLNQYISAGGNLTSLTIPAKMGMIDILRTKVSCGLHVVNVVKIEGKALFHLR